MRAFGRATPIPSDSPTCSICRYVAADIINTLNSSAEMRIKETADNKKIRRERGRRRPNVQTILCSTSILFYVALHTVYQESRFASSICYAKWTKLINIIVFCCAFFASVCILSVSFVRQPIRRFNTSSLLTRNSCTETWAAYGICAMLSSLLLVFHYWKWSRVSLRRMGLFIILVTKNGHLIF